MSLRPAGDIGDFDRERAGERVLTMSRFVEILLCNKWVEVKVFDDLCGTLESGGS